MPESTTKLDLVCKIIDSAISRAKGTSICALKAGEVLEF